MDCMDRPLYIPRGRRRFRTPGGPEEWGKPMPLPHDSIAKIPEKELVARVLKDAAVDRADGAGRMAAGEGIVRWTGKPECERKPGKWRRPLTRRWTDGQNQEHGSISDEEQIASGSSAHRGRLHHVGV